MNHPIEDLKFYGFHRNAFMKHSVLLSRTGYTGEAGFEIYSEPAVIGTFWDACIEKGAVAAGLGARDTLRLEMGLPLYGHELEDNRNAGHTGFGRFISNSKDFIGAAAIRSGEGSRQRLVGIALDGRQAAREGNRILSEAGDNVGIVTSGSYAPSLGHAIALGYVDSGFSREGTRVEIEGRHMLNGKIAALPFYREGTARKSISQFL